MLSEVLQDLTFSWFSWFYFLVGLESLTPTKVCFLSQTGLSQICFLLMPSSYVSDWISLILLQTSHKSLTDHLFPKTNNQKYHSPLAFKESDRAEDLQMKGGSPQALNGPHLDALSISHTCPSDSPPSQEQTSPHWLFLSCSKPGHCWAWSPVDDGGIAP